MCYRAYGTYRIKCMTIRAPSIRGVCDGNINIKSSIILKGKL